jgi:2-methylcitrate dehydratase
MEKPDRVLSDIVDYVLTYQVEDRQAIDVARLCLADTLACAFDALDFEDCVRLLGPLVEGTTVRNGSRVPGTRHELDPAAAAFSFGCMIRWLDLNDTFTGATGGHPSDNLAGILMLADHLSRRRLAAGGDPLTMSEVLHLLIKAYEIQGCLAIENDFFAHGIDHDILVRIASAAVLTRMLGGTRDQILSAVSNAWIGSSLVLYRHASSTGSRKNWACGNASHDAVRLALMAIKGEMGYPFVLTAKKFGFNDARYRGAALKFQRPYGEYVVQNSMFKFIPAGMHGQSGAECAFQLHPLVRDRLDAVARVEIETHRDTMRIMHKTGPLHNAPDRDHCAEYVVALGLIHGRIAPTDFEDDFAADPRIDRLRSTRVMTENARYTADYDDPSKRSNTSSVRVWFDDGTSTTRAEIEYPLGHKRRRGEAMPALREKVAASLGRRFPRERQQRIVTLCDDAAAFDRTPVNEFVDLLIP